METKAILPKYKGQNPTRNPQYNTTNQGDINNYKNNLDLSQHIPNIVNCSTADGSKRFSHRTNN